MAAKRSRLSRSSSSGITSIISNSIVDPSWTRNIQPIIVHNNNNNNNNSILPVNNKPVIVPKTLPDYDRPAIFAISSPVRDPVDRKWDDLVQYGRFFQNCYFCKKKISDDDEIFMYSNLRAFCTDECRTKQIDMDKDLKGMSAKPVVRSGKRR